MGLCLQFKYFSSHHFNVQTSTTSFSHSHTFLTGVKRSIININLPMILQLTGTILHNTPEHFDHSSRHNVWNIISLMTYWYLPLLSALYHEPCCWQYFLKCWSQCGTAFIWLWFHFNHETWDTMCFVSWYRSVVLVWPRSAIIILVLWSPGLSP